MTWLGSNFLFAGELPVLAFAAVAVLVWALRRSKARTRGMRTCRSCNGTGRIFTGVKTGNTQRGNFHICRVCKGAGVVHA